LAVAQLSLHGLGLLLFSQVALNLIVLATAEVGFTGERFLPPLLLRSFSLRLSSLPPILAEHYLSIHSAGATVQIFLFSMNSAKIKLNAPRAHTFLEVIRVRWGKTAHIVFLCFSLVTSLLVSAMLVTGGSATVTDLTGASTRKFDTV